MKLSQESIWRSRGWQIFMATSFVLLFYKWLPIGCCRANLLQQTKAIGILFGFFIGIVLIYGSLVRFAIWYDRRRARRRGFRYEFPGLMTTSTLLLTGVGAVLFLTLMLGVFIPNYVVLFDEISGAADNPYADVRFVEYLMVSVTFFAPLIGLAGITWQTRRQLKDQQRKDQLQDRKRLIGVLTMLLTEVEIIRERVTVIIDNYQRAFRARSTYVARRLYVKTEPAIIMTIPTTAFNALVAEIGSIGNVGLVRDITRFYSGVEQLKVFCVEAPDDFDKLRGRGHWQHWFAKKCLKATDPIIAGLRKRLAREHRALRRRSTRRERKHVRPAMPAQ